jgi:hypothetical protein
MSLNPNFSCRSEGTDVPGVHILVLYESSVTIERLVVELLQLEDLKRCLLRTLVWQTVVLGHRLGWQEDDLCQLSSLTLGPLFGGALERSSWCGRNSLAFKYL